MPQAVTVNESNSITLSCEASGSPAPTFQWFNSSDGLALNSSTPSSVDSSTEQRTDFFYTMSNLTISAAVEGDAGEYRCVAGNGIGGDVEQTYTLTVNCKFVVDIGEMCSMYACHVSWLINGIMGYCVASH